MPFKELASDSIGSSRRLRQLQILIVLALAGGVFLSPVLWFGGGRTFPRAPIFFAFSIVPIQIDSGLSILVLCALGLSIFPNKRRRYLALAISFIGVLVFLDQTRLQPWVFQYAVMLSFLAVPAYFSTELDRLSILRAQQLVIVSLYFWSGAQKINWSFVHEVIPSLLQSAKVPFQQALSPYLTVFGLVVAVSEMLIGLGLAMRQTRRTAVVFAICMHLFVLLMLIATRRNSVVWPWNIAMVAMVPLMFLGTENKVVDRDLFTLRRYGPFDDAPRIAFLICTLAPLFSFVGFWDLYLSAALYSGRSPIGVMRLTESTRDALPPTALQHVFTTSKGELILPFYEWSLSELNTPPYPEPRAYRQIAKEICQHTSVISSNDKLTIRGRPSLLDGSYVVNDISCRDLFDLP